MEEFRLMPFCSFKDTKDNKQSSKQSLRKKYKTSKRNAITWERGGAMGSLQKSLHQGCASLTRTFFPSSSLVPLSRNHHSSDTEASQCMDASTSFLSFSPFLPLQADFSAHCYNKTIIFGINFPFLTCALDTNLTHFLQKHKLVTMFSLFSVFIPSLSTGLYHL